ncbi:DUF421 domain-containing protein [Bacillus sp. H-16]|uniref:DUF421 domain-containing protein n=1 Tax=Alteribacter salitolerans TaxID=2912333 RepID=UPI0019661CA3|nr:DUF421 domain-containing protein [Alteribacter salitolerans]MBM7094716.1 DUF421 domain-containing protein [Alteribacter salitolerans]
MPGWLEVTVRTISALVLILASAKLLVRKNLAHMTQMEFIIMAFFGAMLGVGAVNLSIPIAFPLLGFFIATLFLFSVQLLKLKSRTFRVWVQAQPAPVIKNGKILEEEMKKQRFTSDDLETELRRKGIFNVQDVEFAMLEGSGEVDALLKKDRQPLTAKEMNIALGTVKEAETVIRDGKIQDEALNRLGFSRRWLEERISKKGYSVDNIFLAQADRDGEIYTDLYDDQIKQRPQTEKEALFITLKKVQAELETFSHDTKDVTAKQMYTRNAIELADLKKKLEVYLLI